LVLDNQACSDKPFADEFLIVSIIFVPKHHGHCTAENFRKTKLSAFSIAPNQKKRKINNENDKDPADTTVETVNIRLYPTEEEQETLRKWVGVPAGPITSVCGCLKNKRFRKSRRRLEPEFE